MQTGESNSRPHRSEDQALYRPAERIPEAYIWSNDDNRGSVDRFASGNPRTGANMRPDRTFQDRVTPTTDTLDSIQRQETTRDAERE